jgi:hypothetical protein
MYICCNKAIQSYYTHKGASEQGQLSYTKIIYFCHIFLWYVWFERKKKRGKKLQKSINELELINFSSNLFIDFHIFISALFHSMIPNTLLKI